MRRFKPERVPPGAGHFDVLSYSQEGIEGLGWVFRRPYCISRAVIFVDGVQRAECERMERPDVETVCAWAHDARPFGFRFKLSPHSGMAWPPNRLDVVVYANGRPVARVSTFCLPAESESLPLPPPALAERVSGVVGEHFRLQGLKMFTDLMDILDRFAIPRQGRLLDWGCGCGRVLRWFLLRHDFHLLNFEGANESPLALGCDVDPEALEWCRINLRAPFELVPFDPPTALPSGAYDLVIASSVLTHLDRRRQEQWLQEVHRWLAPGGHFIASTNAEFAFRSKHPEISLQGWRKWVDEKLGRFIRPKLVRGILDDMPDPSIRWFVPADTYRMVFQSRRFTERLCARYFDVIGYVECGLDGFQDVIVCRKPNV